MFGQRLLELRQAVGLTQAQLAARAAVSRQLVGAVENGRHLPRVDAAIALASALGVTVEELHRTDRAPVAPVDAVVGALPPDGVAVRVGRVGDRLVCAATGASFDAWAAADGVVARGSLELLDDARPGVVVVGCDPAIGLAARLVASEPVLAVAASTAEAVDALGAGRAHACVVHGPRGGLPDAGGDVVRWHLSRWQVGLAAAPGAEGDWAARALAGRTEVIQRRPGAGSQAAFERAVRVSGAQVPNGPLVADHLEAAWLSRQLGLPAVTIEPVALAAGLPFHPLEMHEAQLWVGRAWVLEPGVRRLGEVMTSAAFGRRLRTVGGYDLTGTGTAVA